jgi:hypothetical protein
MNTTKKLVIGFFLIMLVTFGLFAKGTAEDGTRVMPSQPDFRTPPGTTFSEEDKVVLTGEVYFENLIHPELRSGRDKYELMVPRVLLSSVELEEGERVTVEGYKGEGALGYRGRWDMSQTDEEAETQGPYLFVTKATVDGVEWDFESTRFGHAGRGGPDAYQREQPAPRGGRSKGYAPMDNSPGRGKSGGPRR